MPRAPKKTTVKLTVVGADPQSDAALGGGGGGGGTAPPGGEAGWDERDLALAKEPKNDLGNARRFLARAEGGHIWCPEKGWLSFDGRRYDRKLGEVEPRLFADRVAEAMLYREARALSEVGRFPDENESQFETRLKSFRSFATSCANVSKTETMLKKASDRVWTPLDKLDPDNAFVTKNGTVRVSKSEGWRYEEGWQRGDLITRLAPVVFDPEAKAPLWRAFLEEMQPDPGMRLFLQRLIGSTLVKGNPEQVFIIFQGRGSDGKSTFLEALAAAMGDMLGTAKVETFLQQQRKGAEASPDIAELAGATRLLRTTEPPKGSVLDSGVIKQFSGGEPVVARGLFKDLFSFVPQFITILSCNERPSIPGNDRGIWRRIVLVPWLNSLPKDKRDTALPEKLRGEAAGILNWILEGFDLWREYGRIGAPDLVTRYNDDYRRGANPLIEWAEDCLVFETAAETSMKEIKQSYVDWGDRTGADIGDISKVSTRLGRYLSNENCIKRLTRDGIMRRGVRLRRDDELKEAPAAEPVNDIEPAQNGDRPGAPEPDYSDPYDNPNHPDYIDPGDRDD